MKLEPVITYDSTISDCLLSVFQIISSINERDGAPVMLDLSKVQYALPSFVIPMLTFILQTNPVIDVRLSEVLQSILFPNGLRAEGMRSLLLKSKLNEYLKSDFLPIIVVPSKAANEDETSNVITLVENALYSRLDIQPNIINGIRYVIGEIIDNVTQHSHSPQAYFYSKINRAERFIEIGISDMGVGLLGSYLNNKDEDILSDIEAIQAANRGISTKNLPDAENRGFGIITSKKMVIDGLKGFYCMISGKAMLLKTPSISQYMELSPEINLNGTIVIFRMPFVAEDFNYINYIE